MATIVFGDGEDIAELGTGCQGKFLMIYTSILIQLLTCRATAWWYVQSHIILCKLTKVS